MLDRLIYFPEASLVETPAHYGLRYDDARIRTSDGVGLHGWLIQAGAAHHAGSSPQQVAARGKLPPVILFFHGNAGNISHRVHRAAWLLERLDAALLMVDYRGYGQSEGRPTEDGLYADAEAAYEYLRARGWGADRIVLFGESLGCAVALELGRRREAAAVILEAPFLSIQAMAREILPIPLGPLLGARYDNAGKISKLGAPVMIAHGESDDVVPFSHGQRLFDLAPEPKKFVPLAGAHHNDAYVIGGERYLDAIEKFLRDTAGVLG